MKAIRFIMLLSVLSLLTYTPLDAASQTRRGVQITPKPSPSLDNLYNQSYAVIIGINAYDKWPSLEYAVNDAKSVQKRLKDMGFETITLLDNYATRENILKVLGDELPKKVEKNDRVIIFFAGHGQTEELADGSQMGYLVPVDSDTRNIFSTAISMDQVRQFSRRLAAKHVLYLIDACYSGLGLTRSGGIPPNDRDYLNKITTRKAHQMLTAGGKGEQAHEEEGHGVFTKYILEGLDGSADRDDKGYVTFSDLASYVKPKVTRMTHNSQVPQYGSIDGEGEFVFVLTKAAPTGVEIPSAGREPVAHQHDRLAPEKPTGLTIGPDLTSLVAATKSSVVSIIVTHAAGQTRSTKGTDDIFDKFFGNPPPTLKLKPEPEAKAKSMGSGFIISRDGYILTNSHVIDQAESIQVKLPSGTEHEAKVIGTDGRTDIALIRIEAGESLPSADLGNSEKLQVGERVIAFGYPWGMEQTVSSGIVSAISAKVNDGFIQTDFSFHPGSSGGPLINLEGKVIGISTAIVQQTQGIGFAIPINTVKSILPELKTTGKVTRGWLGVAVQDITPELANSLKLKQGSGVLVSEVVSGSPADTAGLRTGDLVVEVNGNKIKDTFHIVQLISSLRVGEKTIVKVLRDSRPMTFRAIIAERKD
ncbi:MAG: trypsin-like peptidase domain-containing protein [Syntrophales bacterium]